MVSAPENQTPARVPVHHADGSYTDNLGVTYGAAFMRWGRLVMEGAWDEGIAARVEQASHRAQEIMRSEGFPVDPDDPSDPNRARYYVVALHIHDNS
jgi:hypothetical protein